MKFSIFFSIVFLAFACNVAKPVIDVSEVSITKEVITDDVVVKPLDASNLNAKVNEVFDESCFDKSAAQPGMTCDEDRQPVCGCNKVNYRNPCEALKVGVRYYSWGVCAKSAKTGVK